MIPKIYYQIQFAILEEHFDIAVAILYTFPITGIQEGLDELNVTLAHGIQPDDVIADMVNALDTVGVKASVKDTHDIVEQNWEQQWEESLQPIKVTDDIWITPSWKKEDVKGKYVIVIDPKMSFGTGYHPTTRMVCRMVEQSVTPESQWLDVGTGTGVLAILAVKAGAASCLGFDNDEWSIENAQENVSINEVQNKVTIIQHDVAKFPYEHYHGIAANLYRNLLLPALASFYQALVSMKGTLIVSGILIYDADEIIAEAKKQGFVLQEKLTEGEWCALRFSLGI